LDGLAPWDAFSRDGAAIQRGLAWIDNYNVYRQQFHKALLGTRDLEELPPQVAALAVGHLAFIAEGFTTCLRNEEPLRPLCEPSREKMRLLLESLATCCTDLVRQAQSGKLRMETARRFRGVLELLVPSLNSLRENLTWEAAKLHLEPSHRADDDPDADLNPIHRAILNAVAGATDPVAARAIARKIGRSLSITTHLCGELVALGRLTSVRGCAGGYLPAPDPNPANPANIIPA
jgi:hypothetical protein